MKTKQFKPTANDAVVHDSLIKAESDSVSLLSYEYCGISAMFQFAIAASAVHLIPYCGFLDSC